MIYHLSLNKLHHVVHLQHLHTCNMMKWPKKSELLPWKLWVKTLGLDCLSNSSQISLLTKLWKKLVSIASSVTENNFTFIFWKIHNRIIMSPLLRPFTSLLCRSRQLFRHWGILSWYGIWLWSCKIIWLEVENVSKSETNHWSHTDISQLR